MGANQSIQGLMALSINERACSIYILLSRPEAAEIAGELRIWRLPELLLARYGAITTPFDT
jgi:hypothetical protein